MQSIAGLPMRSYSFFARLLFWKQKRVFGEVTEPSLLWARSPWVFTAFAMFYGALDRGSSPLSPALRSLVMVRVAQLNHCAFCIDINSALLEKRGVPENKIMMLADWRTSDLFKGEERLALEYAEAMSVNKVHDELRGRLKDAWSDNTIIELTALIAYQTLSAKFNAALDIPAQGFCRLPITPSST